jgi:vacuolar-type H+-ATPase subunit E/Vma4
VGLSELIAGLEREAEQERVALARQADAEIRAIETATEEAVNEITARTLAEEQARRHVAKERAVAAARRQARAGELDMRHAQIARILERARELLPEAATTSEYLAALPVCVDDALSYLKGIRTRVRCHPALADRMQNVTARYDNVELVIDASVGTGFVAEAVDGSVAVDHTLVSRLAALAPRLRVQLSRMVDDGRV